MSATNTPVRASISPVNRLLKTPWIAEAISIAKKHPERPEAQALLRVVEEGEGEGRL